LFYEVFNEVVSIGDLYAFTTLNSSV